MDNGAIFPPAGASLLWRVRLFEGPLLEGHSGEIVSRFRSRKSGALLACLAMRLGRPFPREELFAILWPEEADLRVVANRLRVTLASLRRQLEPPGIPFGSVLDTNDRGRIRLRPETVWCDYTAFDEAFRKGRKQEAAGLLTGSLLPGYYEEWILVERARLELLRDELEPFAYSDSSLPAQSASVNLPEAAAHPEKNGTKGDVLPLYLTTFFGREAEKSLLKLLLTEKRLITLIGAGGMGKTRLAVEVCREAPMPVIWVSLLETRADELIPEDILSALDSVTSSHQDVLEQLAGILQRRGRTLLVLDNAENHTEATADLALRLLRIVPELTLLVTSRQSLNIAGEALLPIGPIGPPVDCAPVERLLEFPPIALFVDRARSVRPDFTLAERHIPAMLQISRQLEGVPLALELAAARIATQTPSQIASSLEAGLLQLRSFQHGFAVRHRSLRASIQGSYDQLSSEKQTFFAALSSFHGGWTLEASAAVSGCEQTDEFLDDLVHRSLARIKEAELTGALRGDFLESIRQFAAEQVTEPQRLRLTARHAAYYYQLAATVSEDEVNSLLPLDAEQENLLRALEAGTVEALPGFWEALSGALIYGHVRGRHRLFMPWAKYAIYHASEAPDVKTRTDLRVAGYNILSYLGQLEPLTAISEAIRSDAIEASYPEGFVHAQLILCWVAAHRHEFDDFLILSRECMKQARKLNDALILRRCLRINALLYNHYAVTVVGHDPQKGESLFEMSEILARECLELLPSGSSHLTYVQNILSSTLRRLGRLNEAYVFVKTAQSTALSQGMTALLPFPFRHEYQFAMAQEQWEYAAVLYGLYAALKERTGHGLAQSGSDVDPPLSALQAQLTSDRCCLLLKRGGELSPAFLASFSIQHPPRIDGEGRIR